MKWVIIKGVRYPISVVSAFAAYYRELVYIQEAGDVVGTQGAGRGRVGLGYILPPIFRLGERNSN